MRALFDAGDCGLGMGEMEDFVDEWLVYILYWHLISIF